MESCASRTNLSTKVIPAACERLDASPGGNATQSASCRGTAHNMIKRERNLSQLSFLTLNSKHPVTFRLNT